MESKQPSFFLLFLFLGAGEGGFKLSLLQWVSRWARGWENRGRIETPEAGDCAYRESHKDTSVLQMLSIAH